MSKRRAATGRRASPGDETSLVDLFGIARPPAWTADAACTQGHPDAWWPALRDPTAHTSAVLALDICRTRCPVHEQCLDAALEANEHEGIWGGHTPNQRRRIRAARKSTESDVA